MRIETRWCGLVIGGMFVSEAIFRYVYSTLDTRGCYFRKNTTSETNTQRDIDSEKTSKILKKILNF